MRDLILAEISAGVPNLENTLQMILRYYLSGQITLEEKDELDETARQQAYVADLSAKEQEFVLQISALEQKVNDLIARVEALETGREVDIYADIANFIEGKYYTSEDLVKFGDKIYKCIAPEGSICVWSPEAYATYWDYVSDVVSLDDSEEESAETSAESEEE